ICEVRCITDYALGIVGIFRLLPPATFARKWSPRPRRRAVADNTTPNSPSVTLSDAAEAAGFAADVDLDRVAPGATFRATSTFRNSGHTAWDARYRLAYSDIPLPETAGLTQTQMGAERSYAITDVGAPPLVRPGESVSLTVAFTAPLAPGSHAVNWRLTGPDGQAFGPIRWLRAVVVAAAGSLSYDLLGFRNTAGDFNNLQPGRQFSGIWTLRNSG